MFFSNNNLPSYTTFFLASNFFMLLKKLIFLLLFLFCTWLALATRSHSQWFCHLVATYGGDTIWAAMFLFFLRIFFGTITLWKLALINFFLGASDEVLQLYQAPWIQAIRHTRIGGLLLGFGFLWSDIVCYAIGTLIAFVIILLIEKILPNKNSIAATKQY
jgi:hypothetical protein